MKQSSKTGKVRKLKEPVPVLRLVVKVSRRVSPPGHLKVLGLLVTLDKERHRE
jgi:hypothetical protein